MKPFVLVLDHGTTGVKAYLMDREGRIASQGYQKVPQIYPQPGWVEHDPMVLWQLTLAVIDEAFASGKADWQMVDAIGITNQRETVILWDKVTGEPVHNAIVWQCRRTADWCNPRKQDTRLVQTIQEKTGLVLDAYFSASKIRWLLDHCPEAVKLLQQERLLFGTVDTWILWKLTGQKAHATDYTNASRTMLYNIRTQHWDPELLEIFYVPESVLPQVQKSSSLFGTVDLALTGGIEIPITSLIGDQQSALYGQKCWTPGSTKNTFGTGAFLMMNLGEQFLISSEGLLTTLACDAQGDPAYALEGAIFIAGAAMEWLKEGLGIYQSFDEADAMAQSLSSNDGVYLVPAFVGLGAPYWNSDARGMITGLTQGAGRAHLARAGLESIAYQTDEIMTLMRNVSGLPITALKVDGGVSRSDFLMQFLSNLMNLPVHRMLDAELTAKGAGYLAGLASGFWASADDIAAIPEEMQTFTPSLPEKTRASLKSGWKHAIQQVLCERVPEKCP